MPEETMVKHLRFPAARCLFVEVRDLPGRERLFRTGWSEDEELRVVFLKIYPVHSVTDIGEVVGFLGK